MTSNMKKTIKRELTIRMKIITQFQFQFHILGKNQTGPFVWCFFQEKIFFPSSNIRFNQKCNKCILCNKIKEDGSYFNREQAEAEVVPSSSLVEVDVEVGIGVEVEVWVEVMVGIKIEVERWCSNTLSVRGGWVGVGGKLN